MKNSRSDIQGHTKKVSIHYNSILSKVALEIRIPSCRSHLLHTKTVSIHYYSFLSKVAQEIRIGTFMQVSFSPHKKVSILYYSILSKVTLEIRIPSWRSHFLLTKQQEFTTTVFLVKQPQRYVYLHVGVICSTQRQ